MPRLTKTQQLITGIALMVVMAATRGYHLGNAFHLPDATPALFFIGGLLLATRLGWAGVLLLGAGLIDYLAIGFGGVSSFCVSAAYGFLIPAYMVMWLAGYFTAKYKAGFASKLAYGAGLLGISSLASFFISTTSFHFLSGRIAEPGMNSLLAVAGSYLPTWVGSSFAYVGIAVLLLAVYSVLRDEPSTAAENL